VDLTPQFAKESEMINKLALCLIVSLIFISGNSYAAFPEMTSRIVDIAFFQKPVDRYEPNHEQLFIYKVYSKGQDTSTMAVGTVTIQGTGGPVGAKIPSVKAEFGEDHREWNNALKLTLPDQPGTYHVAAHASRHFLLT
jgi:hypothetical protein